MVKLPHFLQPKPPVVNDGYDVPVAVAPEGVTSILLVDDEPAIRSLCAAALRRDGYFVAEATDGKAAITAAAAAGRVDVVVTDVRMPRMDGVTMADALRLTHPELPIVFVTGYPFDEGKIGPNDQLLNKPFMREDLRRAVETATGRTH